MTALNVDMEQTLTLFNEAVLAGLEIHLGELDREIIAHADHPNNVARFTYGILENGEVIAMAAFCQIDDHEGLVCFNAGYAVSALHRNKQHGTNIFKYGLEELRHGLKKAGYSEFFVETGVEVDNIHSQKISHKVLNVQPIDSIDPESGVPTFGYVSKQIC